jgi:hypothetical protein
MTEFGLLFFLTVSVYFVIDAIFLSFMPRSTIKDFAVNHLIIEVALAMIVLGICLVAGCLSL